MTLQYDLLSDFLVYTLKIGITLSSWQLL